jgi:hypothetical protein
MCLLLHLSTWISCPLSCLSLSGHGVAYIRSQYEPKPKVRRILATFFAQLFFVYFLDQCHFPQPNPLHIGLLLWADLECRNTPFHKTSFSSDAVLAVISTLTSQRKLYLVGVNERVKRTSMWRYYFHYFHLILTELAVYLFVPLGKFCSEYSHTMLSFHQQLRTF